MKNILLYIAGVVMPVFLLSSCVGGRTVASDIGGDTLYLPQYAKGFVVEQLPGGRLLRITDPWQGAEGVTRLVFFSGENDPAPEGFDGVVIKSPPRKVVCMSSTYIAFLDALGLSGSIGGVSGAAYVSNPEIRRRHRDGEVRDVGYDSNLNYEMLAAMSPDAVFAYGVTDENSVMSAKLARLGIPVVYIGDYVEQSPLGKSEWIMAFGYLFGKEEEAAGIFSMVADDYNRIKESIVAIPESAKPVVMLNSPYRDTWFVPGDRSYMVRLIRDAGGVYACSGEDSDVSRPISLESAYVKMLSADIWLNPGQAVSLAQLRTENPRLNSTPPVMNGQVFNCNKRSTPEGGSDFWESGAVRPDIVLEDMVRMLHPGLPEDGELYYFRRLE